MRVWVIKTGEPVPLLPDEAGERFFRAGQVVKALSASGHDVTWWTGQFYHQHKSFRNVPADQVIRSIDGTADIICLSSKGYKNHLGFARLRDHAQVAKQFTRLAPQLERPDIILCAWPTVDLAAAAVKFGRRIGCPVVLDIRDLWPDIIYEKLNAKLPFRTNGLLLPYEIMARRAFRGAKAVTGICQGMIDWGRKRFGGAGPDRVFHQSMSAPVLSKERHETSHAFWTDKGVDFSAPKTRLVWSGSLIPGTDGPTLLAALERLPSQAADQLDVILCGTGSLVPEIERAAKRLPHLTYAGWVDADQLAVLTQRSHVGLLCYLDRFDFQNSVPNKVVDYCVAAMRTLTNLSGEVPWLLGDTDSVISYATGDVDDLIRALTAIADNPGRYRVKHAPARAIFDRHFNADRVLPDYVNWLEELAVT